MVTGPNGVTAFSCNDAANCPLGPFLSTVLDKIEAVDRKMTVLDTRMQGVDVRTEKLEKTLLDSNGGIVLDVVQIKEKINEAERKQQKNSEESGKYKLLFFQVLITMGVTTLMGVLGFVIKHAMQVKP